MKLTSSATLLIVLIISATFHRQMHLTPRKCLGGKYTIEGYSSCGWRTGHPMTLKNEREEKDVLRNCFETAYLHGYFCLTSFMSRYIFLKYLLSKVSVPVP